jgi:hypothetical protein
MSKPEADHLIINREGRLCVRFYRRADGSILTKDCPVGLRATKRRFSSLGKAIATSVLSFFAGVGFHHGVERVADKVLDLIPIEKERQPITGVLEFKGEPVMMGRVVMGDMTDRRESRSKPVSKR